MDSTYMLEMKDVCKSFPGVKALDHISLKVRPGTVNVICGENGAGKSTLMKILTGAYTKDEGEIYFKGEKIENATIKKMSDLGIAMIHQELSPILDMTIAENIFLGREPMKNAFLVDFQKLYADTQDLLDNMHLTYNPRTKMRELSVAGMQLIEITKAVSKGASLIVMDEPTSAITDKEVDILFEHVFKLRSQGCGIIYITHKMDEIFKIADDITIIRDGQYVSSGPASEYDNDKLVELMVGRKISNVFPKETAPVGDMALEVKNLTQEGVFKDVSFQIRQGEIVGFAGLVGAGRTEVMRAVFGLDPYASGKILVEGKEVRIRNTADAISKGIAYISEDRKAYGLVLQRSVRENVTLPFLKKFVDIADHVNSGKEMEAVRNSISSMRIKTDSPETLVSTLSGGNQQKIVIAKWLLGEIKVLIMDEPTRGIDVGSKAEIHKLMSDLANRGVAIIMISSELPEILGMSDRVYVMHDGLLSQSLDREEVSQQRIMKIATEGA